jgi:Icc-related predicted phosphoesterase
MRILHLGDVHGDMNQLRGISEIDFDVVVSTGDFLPSKFMYYGDIDRVSLLLIEKQYQFDFCKANRVRILEAFKGKPVLYVMGNHDFIYLEECGFSSFIRLDKSAITILDKKFYGFSEVNVFTNKFWNFETDEPILDDIVNNIDEDTDVLVTHMPPYKILDRNRGFYNCGNKTLRTKVESMILAAHLFGHIHEADGVAYRCFTLFSNAGISYRLVKI